MKGLRRICWTLVLAALLPGLLLAQDDGEDQAGQGELRGDTYFDVLEVNTVNVDVYVTDKRGNPITGLTQDDFLVYEDKRPMTISNFFVANGGVVETPVGETEEGTETPSEAVPSEPEAPGQPEEEAAVPDEQRLYLVVYIDNFNIRPFNRNRVFRRLRQFLNEQLQRGDEVMLVSYDRSLKYRHPFTSSPELISNALFDLEDETGSAVHDDSDRREILRAIDEAQSLSEAFWRVRTYAESGFNDLSFTVGALSELVDSLAGLPGRKALLYVSDGVPETPGEEFFYLLHQRFQETSVLSTAQEFSGAQLWERLGTKASANRVAFYTIDAAGLRPPTTSGVEQETASQPGRGAFYDNIMISNLQAPLINLAKMTGGKAIINTNDVGPGLERVAQDFKTYYSLAYSPGHSGTGRYYKIKVELKDKQRGVELRYREGYRDQPTHTRMAESAMATLVYDYHRNPLDIRVRQLGEAPDGHGFFDVTLVVEIPIGNVTLVPHEDFHEGRSKLYFVAMDEGGDTSEVQEVPLSMHIPNDRIDEARSQLYPYQVSLKMRQGPHRVAVGLIDEFAAASSFLSKSFVVGG